MGKRTRISVNRSSLLAMASEEDIVGNFEATLIIRTVDNILIVHCKGIKSHEQRKSFFYTVNK